MYFVSNPTADRVTASCTFRCDRGTPQLWDALSGDVRPLPALQKSNGVTIIPLEFFPHGSCFVVFSDANTKDSAGSNFVEVRERQRLEGPWTVAFDPAWGGPAEIAFDQLVDWTSRPESDIRHYSGKATYRKEFQWTADASKPDGAPLFLDLGEAKHLARVRLNGQDLGVLWTSPWHVDISRHVKPGANQLEIDIVNLWPNRMIGDLKLPSDAIEKGKWPDWIKTGQRPKTGRFTWSTYMPFKADTPLIPSGLMGPVTLHW
jgi:hypothetical protein